MGKNKAANSSMTPPIAAGEAIEAIFADEDSNDETFDCGYDLDIIPDSEDEGNSESEI